MEQREAIHILTFAIILIISCIISYSIGKYSNLLKPNFVCHEICNIEQLPNTDSVLLKYGLSSGYNLRYMDDFLISYDTKNRIPFWVLETISINNLIRIENNYRKNKRFTVDKYFYKPFQSTLEDYKKSGYDRGHMAAAGNYLHSKSTMMKTFLLSNIAPQVGKGFNQGIWTELENKIRNVIQSEIYKSAHILTGPLFVPKEIKYENKTIFMMEYEMLRRNVAVPTHFFKVVIFTDKSNKISYMSFVMPNAIINGTIESYYRNISDIEKLAGFRIFPKIDFFKIKNKITF
uniref:Endonuclease n=1 Tax=Parastrongyloides trichosuri TaxID=131310 RepID=A0A0N4ZF44_PARTI